MKGDSKRLFATAIPASTLLVLFAFVFYLPQVQADCSIWDIKVHQEQNGWLGGIPRYKVLVQNLCSVPNGCLLGNAHLKCGDFNTSIPINPKLFRRLNINDCLLVDGLPIRSGTIINFEYTHSEPYPMTVASVNCYPPS